MIFSGCLWYFAGVVIRDNDRRAAGGAECETRSATALRSEPLLTDDDASLSLACMTTVAPFLAPGVLDSNIYEHLVAVMKYESCSDGHDLRTRLRGHICEECTQLSFDDAKEKEAGTSRNLGKRSPTEAAYLSVINIRPQATVANTGMAMREGWRQRLSAIEQAGPPDHPLP